MSQQYSNQFNGGFQGGNGFQGNGGFQGGNAYNPELDQVLYSTPESVSSGKNNQNNFSINIRSYNGTAPKVEFIRTFPGQNGQVGRKALRISIEEWQLLLKYGNEINGKLGQLMQGGQNNNQMPF